MPDLSDTDPDDVSGTPEEPPGPAPGRPDRHRNEVEFKDDRGRLRLPAYILIVLVVALAAVLLLCVALLVAPG